MFSELCRETLRKAAVCYTSGRAGSPSTSPPTSPPSSPAKEAKTSANVELANVHRSSGAGASSSASSAASSSNHQQSQTQQPRQQYYQQFTDIIKQHNDHAGSSNEHLARIHHQQHSQSTAFRTKITTTDNDRANPPPEHRPRKRTAMPTDFGRRSPEYHRHERRRSSHSVSDDYRSEWSSSSSRSASPSNYPDREWLVGYESYANSGRSRDHSRSRSESSGSSTDADDSSTSGDEAGAVPEESNQRSSSAHHRHSLTKDQTMHWFAQIGADNEPIRQGSDVKRRSLYDEDSLDGDHPNDNQGRDSTGNAKDVDRAKLVRDRQNEERQRRIEEMRQQAFAAQRFREQREVERKRRIDELRSRDSDRRNQVEERKRLIWEADRERREAILRKNQEREARIEARKKNERSQIGFAFGSSTPRMLEPADTGGSSFWGTRRATSTTNVMMFSAAQPLTRRSSERELDGSKKRATSAGGLDRKPGEGEDSDGAAGTPSSVYLRVNRRRTDLMPTIPSPRDGGLVQTRSSSSKAFTRSPGRTYSMSRLDQLAQPRKRNNNELGTVTEQTQNQPLGATSMSRSMSHLAAPGAKSLKRTDNSRSMGTLPGALHVPRPTRAERLRRKAREHQTQQQQGVRSGEVTPNSPSRPHSSMSQQSGSSVGSSNVNLRPRTTTPRRPRPASIAGTGVSVTERHNLVGDIKVTKDSKPPLPKVHSTPKKPTTPKVTDPPKKPTDKLIKSARASPRITPKATPLQSPGAEHPPLIRENTTEIIKHNNGNKELKTEEKNEEKKDQGTEKAEDSQDLGGDLDKDDSKITSNAESNVSVSSSRAAKESANVVHEVSGQVAQHAITKVEKKDEHINGGKKAAVEPEVKSEPEIEEIDMSASMIAKIRITTEEEAKAALAERRKLAREQAEREAELERQRLEEEERLEEERLRAEEEEQRRLEAETLRLAKEAQECEEQRLQQAIEEAKRREEEDRKRREEEARLKIEKEEAERKAREEAEKQRLEMVERLKKEEEERLQRRKRVEAIMLRTRGKNQSNTPTKGEGGESDKMKEDSPSDENKPAPGSNRGEDVMTASLISEATQQFITVEQQVNHDGNNTQTDIVRNGTNHRNGINESKTLLESNAHQDNVEGVGGGELNGHHTNHGNGIDSQSITLDNATVKQNNVTNNLLDLTDFDTLSNSSRGPILELSSNLSNEDSLNSNLNPAAMPFTPMVNPFVPVAANANTNPFQDAFINNRTQDNNQVPDLLS
ncbi:MAP7 domain-containing protein 2-like isoform X6 [Venturia canescens]|uniref:MAP7 domain-containing protein 2-like isoform X6 n=1 Tax=Venturia canescens TaxID=32260 RepID=UPI001C9D25B8|nr:MAP7 domain-containing protein 2-like isoform X6 [Venturia canescens]